MTVLRSTTSAAGLALLLGAAALGGCSTSNPTPSTSTSAASSATSTPATTTATTTTPPSASFPPGVPESARAKTPEGAKAFTAYFVGQFNKSWTTPDSKLVSDLCDLSTAPACRDFVRVANELTAKGRRYDGAPITMRSYFPQAMEGSVQPVLAVGVQERRNVINRSGTVVLTDQYKPLRAVYSLTWTTAGWRVVNVQLAA